MKRILASAALLLASAFAFAVPTVIPMPASGVCLPENITGAYACAGGTSGNDLGSPANILKIGNEFAALGGFNTPFELIDNSNGTRGSQVALIFETGGTSGELQLLDPTNLLNFNIFGISLKAGNFYSLYLFNGADLLASGVMENLNADRTILDFTTAGTGTNHKGAPLGLNHAALWGVVPVSPVPEPSTFALAAAGLLGVAMIARRRRQISR